jgi:hypothetical protein
MEPSPQAFGCAITFRHTARIAAPAAFLIAAGGWANRMSPQVGKYGLDSGEIFLEEYLE